MSRRNERLREEVYNYSSDDDFYNSFKKYETTAKNKYVIQRLREIENKRWREANPELAHKSDRQGIGFMIAIGVIVFVVFVLIAGIGR